MTTFEEVWAKKAAEGYQYGEDALEHVRFGWEIHEAEVAAAESDAMALLARGVELFGEDDEKIKRLEARVVELEAELRVVLRSSVPHPVHHPTMWGAWRQAEALLGIPPEKSATIGTCDRALEAQLLADATERRGASHE